MAHPPAAALACSTAFPLELLGGELGPQTEAGSSGDCCAACTMTEGCAAWTYYPNQGSGETSAAGTCALMGPADWDVQPPPAPGVVSSLMAASPAAMGEPAVQQPLA